MNMTKSKYVSYRQCPKKLWLELRHPELAAASDQALFEKGTQVGELARSLFPGGTLVQPAEEGARRIPDMVRRTRALIGQGAPVIYEAAFAQDGLLAICDILVRTGIGSAYDLYEVKSSTQVKDVHVLDAAYQQYVLSMCGIPVRDAYLVHIDNQYMRSGELDLSGLFSIERLTDKTAALQREIAESLPGALGIFDLQEEYVRDIGPHCSDPYDCPFQTYCWRHLPSPSVFDLGQLAASVKFRCYYDGIVTFEDVARSQVRLNAGQRLQLEAELTGDEIFNARAVRRFLSGLCYPLYFLDFETFAPPVPLFDGTRPYEQVPTQYSLHFMAEEGGPLEHREFLAQEGTDPRRPLAERLVRDITPGGCVLAYNMSFEKGVLRNLASRFPDLSDELLRICDSIDDLMIPFKNKDYYTKAMRGKYSIKYVLPALYTDDPALSYAGLYGIHNGREAADAFAALPALPQEERERVRASLLDYCRLDTLAMVKIWDRLREKAGV